MSTSNALTLLSELAGQIREMIKSADGLSWKIAELITDAFDTYFKDSDERNPREQWADWCKEEFRYCRRYALGLDAITRYLREAKRQGIDLSAVHSTSFDKLSCLCAIKHESLSHFLSVTKINELDRDGLRDAVRSYLGKVSIKPQLEFFASLDLPEPAELLELMADHKGLVSYEKSMKYGETLMRVAVKNLEFLSDAKINTLRSDLSDLMLEAFGYDIESAKRYLVTYKETAPAISR